MSHINYAFNPEDDALPRDKMKLRNTAAIGPPSHIPIATQSYFILSMARGSFRSMTSCSPCRRTSWSWSIPTSSTPKSALNHTRWNILCLASKGWNLRFPMPPRAAFAFIPLKRITMCWSVCARSCGKCRTESRVSRYFARPTWILSLYS